MNTDIDVVVKKSSKTQYVIQKVISVAAKADVTDIICIFILSVFCAAILSVFTGLSDIHRGHEKHIADNVTPKIIHLGDGEQVHCTVLKNDHSVQVTCDDNH